MKFLKGDFINMNDSRNLLYCNFVVYGDKQWFWSINFNALFTKNIKSGKVKRVGKYIRSKGATYNNIILYCHKIITIPGIAKKIMIFNIREQTFHFVNIEIPEYKENCNLFYGHIVVKDCVFMIGNQIPYILKFNMKTEKVEGIINLYSFQEEKNFYFRDGILDKNKLIVPAIEENSIFEVNIETLQWKKKKIEKSEDGFSTICKVANSIWLMPRHKGAILQWDKQKNIIIEHEIEKLGFRYRPLEVNFHSAIYVNNKVWIFPFSGNMVLSFDLETGKMSKDNAVNRYLNEIDILSQPKGCRFRLVQMFSDCIYLLCCYTGVGKLLIYNPKIDELQIFEEENKISTIDYLEYLESQNIYIINEEDFILEDFIDFILNHQVDDQEIDIQRKKNYGHEIYEVIDHG